VRDRRVSLPIILRSECVRTYQECPKPRTCLEVRSKSHVKVQNQTAAALAQHLVDKFVYDLDIEPAGKSSMGIIKAPVMLPLIGCRHGVMIIIMNESSAVDRRVLNERRLHNFSA